MMAARQRSKQCCVVHKLKRHVSASFGFGFGVGVGSGTDLILPSQSHVSSSSISDLICQLPVGSHLFLFLGLPSRLPTLPCISFFFSFLFFLCLDSVPPSFRPKIIIRKGVYYGINRWIIEFFQSASSGLKLRNSQSNIRQLF